MNLRSDCYEYLLLVCRIRGSYSGGCEKYYLLGYNALQPVESQPTFRKNIDLPPAFTLLSCSVYSTLKMEAICSPEMSIDFQWTTWQYIPEDSTRFCNKVAV
jgi:hypothetical protein